jgi:hypothetical protein
MLKAKGWTTADMGGAWWVWDHLGNVMGGPNRSALRALREALAPDLSAEEAEAMREAGIDPADSADPPDFSAWVRGPRGARRGDVWEIERQAITQEFVAAGLDGNGRFLKIGHALSAIANILEPHRFQIATTITPWDTPGASGHRTFPVERITDDPFSPEPFEDSVLAFSWYLHEPTGKYEIIAYMS